VSWEPPVQGRRALPSSPASRRLDLVATGTIDGVIMIDEAGCSNNGHRWALDQLLPPTHR
jgi:hypothetical protein